MFNTVLVIILKKIHIYFHRKQAPNKLQSYPEEARHVGVVCKNLRVAQPEVGISISLSDEITRIIQSLYYAPAGRYINSSSDSADRGRSIIRVTDESDIIEFSVFC